MKAIRIIFLVPVVVLLSMASVVPAQDTRLSLKQLDGGPAEPLTAAELLTLGDPFFNLVLRDHAQVTSLSTIEDLIQPDKAARVLYVVDESLVESSLFGQSRRAVLAFRGENRGETVHRNIMISFFFNSQGIGSDFEVLSWDAHRGRYNFYRLDKNGTPEVNLAWKFRGSSQDVDLLSAGDRQGTCMACHINGGPIMKELALPWNNWHSFSFSASYLTPVSPPASRWPIANSELFEHLAGAQDLETDFVLDAIRNFNTSRVNATLARSSVDGDLDVDESGLLHVLEGRRLLRPLFLTTEVNLDSSRETSGVHPFGGAAGSPQQSIQPPLSLFLNAILLGGNTISRIAGLGIPVAGFGAAAQTTRAEYQKAVSRAQVRLDGKLGDANFAWFIPAPSHMDNDLVNQLLQRGIVPPHLVAAVLAVDLEEPILSKERASLLDFVPDRFSFAPLAAGSDPLTAPFDLALEPEDGLVTQIVAALESSNPAPDTAAAKLLARLSGPSPRTLLAQDIEAYRDRIVAEFHDPDPIRRAEAIDRLMAKAVRLRRALLEHDTLHSLDETSTLPGTSRLLPLPN